MSDYYRNNGSNNDKKPSISTRSYKAYNNDQPTPVALEWSFTDDMIRLIFTPQLPESKRTENKMYDYDNSWFTCLTRMKALDLLIATNETILPILSGKVELENGKSKSVAVPVGTGNSIGIGINKDSNGNVALFARFTKNIQSETRISEEHILYQFRDGFIINDYDPDTGDQSGTIKTHVEFYLFLKDISSFLAESSNAGAHAMRVVDKYFKDTLMSDIRSIGKQVGAVVSEPSGNYRNNSRSSTALWQKDASRTPDEEIKSLEDINAEFDGMEVPF